LDATNHDKHIQTIGIHFPDLLSTDLQVQAEYTRTRFKVEHHVMDPRESKMGTDWAGQAAMIERARRWDRRRLEKTSYFDRGIGPPPRDEAIAALFAAPRDEATASLSASEISSASSIQR